MLWGIFKLKKALKRKKMYSLWGDTDKNPGTKLLKIVVSSLVWAFIMNTALIALGLIVAIAITVGLISIVVPGIS